MSKSVLLSVAIIIASLFLYPAAAFGYATDVNTSDCECKWHKSELKVWIDNYSDYKYTNIVKEAIKEWEGSFERLSYKVYTHPPGGHDIVIRIHKMYGNQVGLPKDTVGSSANLKKPNSDELIHVSINLPTSYRNGYGSVSKIDGSVFYNMVLHEFGHAIGLGHAEDNGKKPLDPMYHKFFLNEDRRQVSEQDVETLQQLYED